MEIAWKNRTVNTNVRMTNRSQLLASSRIETTGREPVIHEHGTVRLVSLRWCGAFPDAVRSSVYSGGSSLNTRLKSSPCFLKYHFATG